MESTRSKKTPGNIQKNMMKCNVLSNFVKTGTLVRTARVNLKMRIFGISKTAPGLFKIERTADMVAKKAARDVFLY